MNKIPNTENVQKIIMHPSACVKCQIGQDWYKINFDACFIPTDCYPDYMEVQKYVMNEIDGKELNIEQATRLLYDFLNLYKPADLEVTANVSDNKVHFDVEVSIF